MYKNYAHLLGNKVFALVGAAAESIGTNAYVVGGYVRDLLLHRNSKDIDFVTEGSGIELAQAVAAALGQHTSMSVFRTYGTAQVKHSHLELEFVGARKESYHPDSRNPEVTAGTLAEDIARRDFTINAMAISVTSNNFGFLIDNYNGIEDLENGIIRTPLDPDITFSDDPLRMMRAIRFATQLNFTICPETFDAITRNADRIRIITIERITTELQKIMASRRPSIGWDLLLRTGLLKIIFPELTAMRGVETLNGRGHKDNFYHTLQVLDNVAENSDDIWLRWSALLHDIGKPVTKRWVDKTGWTFHNHNYVGSRMVARIFRRLRLPLGEEMHFVEKMVDLHMRPQALVEDVVTDSAVRRLINYAENDLTSLMILARADITSKNIEKKKRFLENFDLVDAKFRDIMAKDKDAAFRPSLNGNEIMQMFGLSPSPQVGAIMKALTQAQKECEIEMTRQAAIGFVKKVAAEMGIPVVKELNC